jgi:hypothetical protein
MRIGHTSSMLIIFLCSGLVIYLNMISGGCTLLKTAALSSHPCRSFHWQLCPLCSVQAFVQPLPAVAMSGAQDSLTAADSQAQPLEIEIDNEAEREFTLIRVRHGAKRRQQQHMAVSNARVQILQARTCCKQTRVVICK